ncbi:MAG TPA: carbohydrate ABC transporter permease [Chloroflexota bacterium]|nr:carbohydrate ABC transporter permease [Chloroflexota bacterium]
MVQQPIHRRRRRVSGREQAVVYILLALGALIMLFPLIDMVLMSFKSMSEIGTAPVGLPQTWLFSNYGTAWSQGNLGQYLVNSAIVSACSVVFVLLLSSLAAYVLARFEFPGNAFIYLLFLAGLALPIQLIAVPLFIIMKDLSLLNTLISVILVYTASGMSFSVFLLVNFFRTIPVDLEEAASIEGANSLSIYWLIMLPLLRPAFTTVGLFNFVSSWNALFFPLIFLNDNSKMTVTVGVLSFVGQYSTQWNLLLPALVIITLPTVLVCIVASRQFIRGLTAGALRM